MLIRAVDHKEKQMNDIMNYDCYVADFEAFVLPEYKNRADSILCDAIEALELDEELDVVVKAEMCKDGVEHTFRFCYLYEVKDAEMMNNFAYLSCR